MINYKNSDERYVANYKLCAVGVQEELDGAINWSLYDYFSEDDVKPDMNPRAITIEEFNQMFDGAPIIVDLYVAWYGTIVPTYEQSQLVVTNAYNGNLCLGYDPDLNPDGAIWIELNSEDEP